MPVSPPVISLLPSNPAAPSAFSVATTASCATPPHRARLFARVVRRQREVDYRRTELSVEAFVFAPLLNDPSAVSPGPHGRRYGLPFVAEWAQTRDTRDDDALCHESPPSIRTTWRVM